MDNGVIADATWLFSKYDKDPVMLEKFLYGYLEQGAIQTDQAQQAYEISEAKVQEFGEYDARLWES